MHASPAQEHWSRIYSDRPAEELSWFETEPLTSLDLLLVPSLKPDQPVVDIGGGASGIAAALLDRGFTQVTVLDIADAALEKARLRLGARADRGCWIEADITAWEPDRVYRAWHDRAVFHFLTSEAQRRAYRSALEAATSPGAIVVIGTFALSGPERCSGLPVERYSAERLADELGEKFRWTATRKVEHRTPAGQAQNFQFSRFVRE